MATKGLVLVILVALAGCLSAVPAPPGDGAGPTPAGEWNSVPADAEQTSATVTRVVDGDTVEVTSPNGTTDTVRLVGIDTPETRGGTNPEEFEGVPATADGRACLARAADNVTRALARLVADEPVTLVVDPATDRRDRYDRLLAYVVVDETNVNELLVARGHARVYDTAFSLSETFYEHERAAQEARRGVWDCIDPRDDAAGSGPVGIRVVADAPGDDRDNPNGEYVVLSNDSPDPLAIGNWTLSDAAGHSYRFPPTARIPANGTVRVYSGSGADTDTAFYRGDGPIWNNDGDTATLRAANGTVVATASY